jgi:hypothetical protein
MSTGNFRLEMLNMNFQSCFLNVANLVVETSERRVV